MDDGQSSQARIIRFKSIHYLTLKQPIHEADLSLTRILYSLIRLLLLPSRYRPAEWSRAVGMVEY